MKKTFTIITISFFLLSIYIIPSANAITLGEIKPESKNEINKANKIPDDKQQVTATTTGKEHVSPRLVCLLSVIMPGGGHFYMNRDAKGMSFCLAAGAGYTATGFFMVKTMLAERGSVAYKNYMLLTGFMFFITLIIHFVGIIEAYSAADEINKKNLFNSNSDNPYPVRVITEK